MNSNCALCELYFASLIYKVEINLGGGVRFLAVSLPENKSEDNCIVDFARRLFLSIREGLLFVCIVTSSFSKAVSDFSFTNAFLLTPCSKKSISKQKIGWSL